MREILFRGKRIDNGEWIYGFYFYDSFYNKAYITIGNYCMTASTIISNQRIMNALEVDPNTVGQYTELKDKDGKKVFEGDICSFCDTDGGLTDYEILWFGGKWVAREANSNAVDDLFFCERSVVIGNIYDNPELIGDEKELKIREVCGDYALDIPFADGSVNTIYFNSKRNAETVKHIIEVDGSNSNNATECEMEEIRHGKWIEYDNGVQTCSECGEEHEWQDYRASYCEDCGAKMDKE